jgi:hypothetical protein
MAPAPTVSVPTDLLHHAVLPHEELDSSLLLSTDKMNNSNSGKPDDSAAAASFSAAAAPAKPDLKTLSMTLPSRKANDYVEDKEKIKKMADAVRVLLEVRGILDLSVICIHVAKLTLGGVYDYSALARM